MKLLSDTESAVCTAMQFDADLSVTEVAALTGLKGHTIRRTISLLRERGLIERSTMINRYCLGTQAHHIRIALLGMTPKVRAKLHTTVKRYPNIVWVRECGGHYHFEFIIESSNDYELAQTFDAFIAETGGTILRRVVTCMLYWTSFKRRYLPVVIQKTKTIDFKPGDTRIEIDALDDSLLEVLTRENLFSYREIGERLGIPASTAEYRLRTLRKKGVIVGSGLNLKIQKLGILHYRLYLRVSEPQQSAYRTLLALAKQNLYIASLITGFGDWSFSFRLELPALELLSDILSQVAEALGDSLRDFDIVPVLSTVKSTG